MISTVKILHLLWALSFVHITSTFEIHLQVKQTAENVDVAVRDLPDANTVTSTAICYLFLPKSFWLQWWNDHPFGPPQKPDDLWKNHSKAVHPKPHRKDNPAWKAIQKVLLSYLRSFLFFNFLEFVLHYTTVKYKRGVDWWILRVSFVLCLCFFKFQGCRKWS